MGAATGVVKIHTVRIVRHKGSANCRRIPAKTISYLSELRKVRRSDAMSTSCPFLLQIVSEPFMFFAYRMRLRLAIKTTQKEAVERIAM